MAYPGRIKVRGVRSILKAARLAGLLHEDNTFGRWDNSPFWTVTPTSEPAPMAFDAACARCGEHLDAHAGQTCNACQREIARKQDTMIAEAAAMERAA